MKRLLERTVQGLTRRPRAADWGAAAACWALMVAIAPLASRFFAFPDVGTMAPLGDPRLWLWIGIIFVSPGITEEILFRCWMLRFRDEVNKAEYFLRWGVSQILYIAWHPFFLGIIEPARMAVFGNGVFLFLAFWVGCGSCYLYLRSRSLWPSILFHWGVVASWYLFGGGFLLLHQR